MKVLTLFTVLAVALTAYGGQTTKNPIEIGDVQWGRDFEAALKNSAVTQKPVLILFQEVPG